MALGAASVLAAVMVLATATALEGDVVLDEIGPSARLFPYLTLNQVTREKLGHHKSTYNTTTNKVLLRRRELFVTDASVVDT
jgi:hypothetical protein